MESPSEDHRIGPDDLLEITVFEAPELGRSVRVSGVGEVSLPLLGIIAAAGLTAQELEVALEERLRNVYMNDPHVSVQVSETRSLPITVLGAVNRPGVFQVRGKRTLLEVLAMAEGLSADAGEGLVLMRGAGTTAPFSGAEASPPEEAAAQEIDLKELIESGDARLNVSVHPGDIVKVKRADVVYVVGEVNQPGAYPLTGKQGLTVLQAVALGAGLRPSASKGRTLIIRTTQEGERTEIPVDLGDILSGKAVDPPLQAKDIVFVPNSSGKSVALGLVDALIRMVTLRAVF